MVNSKRIYTKRDLPVPPSLWWAPANPGPYNTSIERSLLWSLLLSSGSRSTPLPSKTRALCFPQSSGKYNPNPLALQGRFPEDSQSLLSDPQAGKPDKGSEPSQQCDNFFGIIILQSVAHLAGMGFDFIDTACSPASSLHDFSFDFGSGPLFLVVQCPPTRWLFKAWIYALVLST